MRGEGVESRDLQTSGLSIEPRYVYPRAGGRGRAAHRRLPGLQHAYRARLRDIERVGEVLDLVG